MANKYEVWEQLQWNRSGAKPVATYYTIDIAIDAANKESKGKTHIQKIWNPKYDPNNIWGGAYEDLTLPDIFIVVERAKLTTLRGVSVSGKFLYPKNCPRCNGTGNDVNVWGTICRACNFAGWKLP